LAPVPPEQDQGAHGKEELEGLAQEEGEEELAQEGGLL
jgi:hypothetical protein